MKMRIPDSLRRHFWDVDPNALDARRHSRFIIERILDRGDVAAVQWLLHAFDREEVLTTLKTSRRLTRKSAAFWAAQWEGDPATVRALSDTQQDWRV